MSRPFETACTDKVIAIFLLRKERKSLPTFQNTFMTATNVQLSCVEQNCNVKKLMVENTAYVVK